MHSLSLETGRLRIRWLGLDDAGFIYRLVNDPDWIRFIGDKSVRNLDDARAYLESGPLKMYRDFGFGLNRVALRGGGDAIGICGILQRDSLPCADLGFAFLPEYRRRGYALEAGGAVLEHAATGLEKKRLAAILSPKNLASASLLKKLGFRYAGPCCAEDGAAELDLYQVELGVPRSRKEF